MQGRTVGLCGAALLALVLLAAIFAGQLAPYDPSELVAQPLLTPSIEHPLGTNDIGQDIMSELIYGTRASLLVGGLSTLLSLLLGTLTGVLAGWLGGWVDRLLMKLVGFFLTLPFLPSVIILSAFAAPGPLAVSIILGALSWPFVARVVRARTMQLRTAAYIQAIQAMGAGNLYIMLRHLLRELAPLLLYHGVLRMKAGILMESSLSFLGLGDPTVKSWGSMLYYAQAKNALITGAWIWWVIPPGVCIGVVCLALMMVSYAFEARGPKREGRYGRWTSRFWR